MNTRPWTNTQMESSRRGEAASRCEVGCWCGGAGPNVARAPNGLTPPRSPEQVNLSRTLLFAGTSRNSWTSNDSTIPISDPHGWIVPKLEGRRGRPLTARPGTRRRRLHGGRSPELVIRAKSITLLPVGIVCHNSIC